jgi:hypothetical protein
MLQEKHQQTIDNKKFFILNFSSFNPLSQLFFSVTLFSSKDKKISPILSPSKVSDDPTIITDADATQDQWKLMHEKRLEALVSPEASAKMYFYLGKDEIQQSIVAEKSLRILEKKSLELLREMILSPEAYPLISSNLNKNEFLEDMLFKNEHFAYCYTLNAEKFYPLLFTTPAFAENNIISEYFTISDNEVQKEKVLSFINEELAKIEARGPMSEILSDITAGSNVDYYSFSRTKHYNSPDEHSLDESPNGSKSSSKKSHISESAISAVMDGVIYYTKSLFKSETPSKIFSYTKVIPVDTRQNDEGKGQEGEDVEEGEGESAPHHLNHI